MLHAAPNVLPGQAPSDAREWLLVAAYHALRSYQFGNASPDLAAGIADLIEAELAGKANDPGES
jgi:hypothetical protein